MVRRFGGQDRSVACRAGVARVTFEDSFKGASWIER
jgi:hypothetical protein